jgi:hypothetical protein
MTSDNASSLASQAAGKTTREVEQIVARLDPKPVPADVVRPITGALPSTPVQTEVLTESLSRKHMTIDAEFDALFEAARDALSHAIPGASELEILKEGLRRIIRDAQKRRGIVDKPRKDREATNGDIPQSVRRIVWKRDQGKRQWRSADGNICGSTYRAQLHHKQDRAKGGLGSPDNVIVLCQTHNLLAAEIAWGEPYMRSFQRRLDMHTPPSPGG